MKRGKVKFFNERAGYGFIVPDEGGEDVLVHIRNVEGGGVLLTSGEVVQFKEQTSPRSGKREALLVQVVGEA